MGKRIRYPKNKKEQKGQPVLEKEKTEVAKTHFVLDVHNSTLGGNSKFGK